MVTIGFCRIDDRLIHGQIIHKWLTFLNCNEVIIVDNQIVDDVVAKGILKMSIPPKTKLTILSLKESISYLLGKKNNLKSSMLLVREPKILKSLIDDEVLIDVINIGRLPTGLGKTKLFDDVYVTAEELEILKGFLEKNITVNIQMIPDSKEVLLNEIINIEA